MIIAPKSKPEKSDEKENLWRVRIKIQKGSVVGGCSLELKKIGVAAAVAVQNIKVFLNLSCKTGSCFKDIVFFYYWTPVYCVCVSMYVKMLLLLYVLPQQLED